MSQPPEEPVPEPSEARSDENLSVIDLDTVAWQPRSRRQRLVQLALLVLIVAVALATLWRATRLSSARPSHLLPVCLW